MAKRASKDEVFAVEVFDGEDFSKPVTVQEPAPLDTDYIPNVEQPRR